MLNPNVGIPPREHECQRLAQKCAGLPRVDDLANGEFLSCPFRRLLLREQRKGAHPLGFRVRRGLKSLFVDDFDGWLRRHEAH